MKRFFLFLVLLWFVGSGCATLPVPIAKPIISQGTWENIDRDRVYGVCLMALTDEGFPFRPRDTNPLGAINTQWIHGYLYQYSEFWGRSKVVKYKYVLKLIIYSRSKNTVTVSASMERPSWFKLESCPYSEIGLTVLISNIVAKDLERLYIKIEELLGRPACYKKDKIIDWIRH